MLGRLTQRAPSAWRYKQRVPLVWMAIPRAPSDFALHITLSRIYVGELCLRG